MVCYAGMANQAAGNLPLMVPDPNSHPMAEDHSSSWQAHSFQAPLQVWHQLWATAMSQPPKSLQGPAPAEGSMTGSQGSGSAVWGLVPQAAKGVLSWSSLQELGVRAAGRLPGLVPVWGKPSSDDEEGSQVGSAMQLSIASAARLGGSFTVAAPQVGSGARGCKPSVSFRRLGCT